MSDTKGTKELSTREELDTMKKEFREVAHQSETTYEATQAIVNDIIKVGKGLDYFRKKWKILKPLLDKNKDGKIQAKELMNPLFFKWILIVLLSVGSTVLFNTASNFIFEGVAEWGVALTVMQYLIGPFIFGVMVKGTMDDFDRRLKKELQESARLNDVIAKERLDKITDDNKHEIAIVQLAGSLDLKNIEIDWLRKYGTIPELPKK